jgi:hypothetical protein
MRKMLNEHRNKAMPTKNNKPFIEIISNKGFVI